MLISRFPNFLPNVDRSYAPLRRSSTGNGGCCAAISLPRRASRRDSLERDKSAAIRRAREREEDHYSRSCRSMHACRSRQFHASRHVTPPRRSSSGSPSRPAVRTSRRRRSPLPAFDANLDGSVVSSAPSSLRCRSAFDNRSILEREPLSIQLNHHLSGSFDRHS